ncbi:uncharacterized protein LY79DRAFT_590874 [Colletotrichum navitas]|uniref:AIG2-like family protein n=1 Tax=Colletotrichum navitas TaxID=681940 RepID=A0AAD8PX98_9PEZI|nr:uncharacterized protein LY79DRAFT_590874 [Colletotrichum navitas]KAK1589798.1 hypothetical protein LY79DRAFT_590874 [Colletotrichum navitas]
MSSSRIPSSRKSSSNTSLSKNHIFLYGIWSQPKTLYNLILSNSDPDPVLTERFTFIQATLSDDPLQSPLSDRRGASIKGVYVTGLTEAEIQKMDSFLTDCARHEVFVQFICRHGKNCTRKAFVWIPRSPAIDGIQAWDAAPPSRPSGGPNGGANGGARGFNPGATQGSNLTFGGAAFAA